MVIELPNPNFMLQRGCKVMLNVNNAQAYMTSNKGKLNSTLTGQWLIVGIDWQYSGGKFKQIVRVVRRELPGGNSITT
jgi:hypothetical protein